METKEHICARMIEYIESTGITVTQWEERAMKDNVPISVGYLRKALKKGTNIGFEILDYFLDIFPDVDLNWLLRIEKSKQMNTKPTSVQNEPAITKKEAAQKETFFREFFEKNSEYSLLPKQILSDYEMYPKTDIVNRAKERSDAIEGFKKLIEVYEKEIADLRSRLNVPAPAQKGK